MSSLIPQAGRDFRERGLDISACHALFPSILSQERQQRIFLNLKDILYKPLMAKDKHQTRLLDSTIDVVQCYESQGKFICSLKKQ